MAASGFTTGIAQAFAEVSPQTVKTNVVREGFAVPAVTWNLTAHDFFADNLVPVVPVQEPRVVSQTIAAGTPVPPGTRVNLVLAPPAKIPVSVFDHPHTAVVGKNVGDLTTGLLADNDFRKTLLKYNSAADVSPEDKVALTSAFNTAHVTIDEAKTDSGFTAAFNTFRNAAAFR